MSNRFPFPFLFAFLLPVLFAVEMTAPVQALIMLDVLVVWLVWPRWVGRTPAAA